MKNGEKLVQQLQDEIYLLKNGKEYQEYAKIQGVLQVGKRVEELLLLKQKQIDHIQSKKNVPSDADKIPGTVEQPDATPEQKKVQEAQKEADDKQKQVEQELEDELELPEIGLDEDEQD